MKVFTTTKENYMNRQFIYRVDHQNLDDITLAVSSQWHTFPQRVDWIAEQGFAMAHTPDARNLQQTPEHVQPYLDQDIAVRHHGYFPGFELGDSNAEKAQAALALHKQAVDIIAGLGEQVITVHIGLVPTIQLDSGRTEENFCKFVEYARSKGVTIALENLRRGPASAPEYVVDLARKAGSAITLDVGHAVSSDLVEHGESSVPEIIDMFSHSLIEVHFYEYETDNHYAPKDMSILAPIVDELLKTQCSWWTIELDEHKDILFTSNLVQDYLASKYRLAAS